MAYPKKLMNISSSNVSVMSGNYIYAKELDSPLCGIQSRTVEASQESTAPIAGTPSNFCGSDRRVAERKTPETTTGCQKLSRMARKKVRWRVLRKQEMANKSADPLNTPLESVEGKRVFSQLSPPSPKPSLQNKPRASNCSTSHDEDIKYSRVAVVKEQYPTAKLLQGEVDQINMDILKRFDEVPSGGYLPIISNYYLCKGALYIVCPNEETENWLRNSFNDNNSTIEGATLKVLGMEEMPKAVKVAFKTKDIYTEDPRKLLQRLERMNPALHTEDWRVISNNIEPNTRRLILEIDEESADNIKEMGYFALTGLDRGLFKILHDSRSKRQEEATTQASSSQVQLEQ